VRPLAVGIVAAAAVIALPALVARGGNPTPVRFAVAATIGGAGLAAFLARPPVVIPAPPREARSPQLVARGGDTLIIRAGPPTVFAPEAR
jgi:hypothetical protein